MSLKIEFVERAMGGERVAALAKEFGVTRAVGYKWIKRFKEEGYDGLDERSRRPSSTPLATAEDIVLAVLEERERHPTWGPRKLEIVLRRTLKDQAPSGENNRADSEARKEGSTAPATASGERRRARAESRCEAPERCLDGRLQRVVEN